MPVTDDPVAELKRSYEILNVSPTATTHVIKQAYRKLAKRWHPDLYSPGTTSYAEATQMMKAINEAYSSILHAPLRYCVEGPGTQTSRPAKPRSQSGHPSPSHATRDWEDVLRYSRDDERFRSPMWAKYEFWTRFVLGMVPGAIFGFLVLILFSFYPPLAWFLFTAVVFVFAIGTTRRGDEFWHYIWRRYLRRLLWR